MGPDSEGQTVLVVDDESMVLNMCKAILKMGGYKVLTASSGAEALRITQNGMHAVDLALLDVMMPGMNGIELARQLQNDNSKLKVVLMTGFGPAEIGRLAGDKTYRVIWKPFQTESLLKMIENSLGTSDLAAEA